MGEADFHSSPLPALQSLPLPYLFSLFPSLFPSLSSIPLKVGPLNPVRGSGEGYKLL